MICCAFSFEIEASVLHRTLKHLFGIGGLILECLRPPYPAPKHWPTQHWPSFHSLSTHQSCARTRGSEAHFHRRHPKHRKQLWSSRSAQTYQYQSATSNISDVALIGASRNINIYIYIHIYIISLVWSWNSQLCDAKPMPGRLHATSEALKQIQPQFSKAL